MRFWAVAVGLCAGRCEGGAAEAFPGVARLHETGLRGEGQVIGIGDTGVDLDSCAFSEPGYPPWNTVDLDRQKVVAYFTELGDAFEDDSTGHGTHIAGCMVSAVPGSEGVAPGAKLAVSDVVRSTGSSAGDYNVRASSLGSSYFDHFRSAGAQVVCSPWGFEEGGGGMDDHVDHYVASHPDFLPIFPAGNSVGAGGPHSPCSAKNALCVGASYSPRDAYLAQPSFVHTALSSTGFGCGGQRRAAEDDSDNSSAAESGGLGGGCATREVRAVPAVFGSTAPTQSGCTQSRQASCMAAGFACPECAFHPSALSSASGTAVQAVPADACDALQNFTSGAVCVAQRGSCSFAQKARRCQEAGAVGVVVVNGAPESSLPIMSLDAGDAGTDITIPVVVISHAEASEIFSEEVQVTFPVISANVSVDRAVPYSSHGPLPDGRAKPELVAPGDGVDAAASGEGCALRTLSGTSQSCGVVAALAALVWEYLQSRADPDTARLRSPSASTLKAFLVALAAPDGSLTSAPLADAGFGLPRPSALLPALTAPGADGGQRNIVVQASLSLGERLRVCVSVPPGDEPEQVVLAWTDPASASGLVNDLDLTISCDLQGWTPLFGNAQADGDRSNNVEKVVLPPRTANTSCILTVRFARSAAGAPEPQSLSLVALGGMVVHPECSAASSALPCEQGSAVQTGTVWRCQCEPNWAGPDCGQRYAGPGSGRVLQPLHWAFARVLKPSAEPDGELVVEHDGASGDLAVFASSRANWNLWGSSFADLVTSWGSAGRWQEGLVNLTANGETGDDRQRGLSIQVEGHTGTDLFVSIWSRGRSGGVSFSVAWRPAAASTSTYLQQEAIQAETGWKAWAVAAVAIAVALVGCALATRLLWDRRKRLSRVEDEESTLPRLEKVTAWSATHPNGAGLESGTSGTV